MNPHKGDVVLQAGSESYTLRFSIDAICHLELTTGKPFARAAAEMASPETVSMTLARHLLHAALLDHHPEISLKEAGDLIPAAGGLGKVTVLVFDAFRRAFPEASGTARPPRAARRRAGTTSAS